MNNPTTIGTILFITIYKKIEDFVLDYLLLQLYPEQTFR